VDTLKFCFIKEEQYVYISVWAWQIIQDVYRKAREWLQLALLGREDRRL